MYQAVGCCIVVGVGFGIGVGVGFGIGVAVGFDTGVAVGGVVGLAVTIGVTPVPGPAPGTTGGAPLLLSLFTI